MTSIEDRVVQTVLDHFDRLPQKSKPRALINENVAEWVPLSGIVLCTDDGYMSCVGLGTGMKCLPLGKVSAANGVVLHDWHAEVLAMRAFNRYLLEECHKLALSPNTVSEVLVRSSPEDQPSISGQRRFSIRPDIRIFFYCSEAPCGDASMELIMEKQEDATPWPLSDESTVDELLGRGSFSELGVVRRKPARPDSPVTLSKSCSDKIALKQCTSLLLGLAAKLVSPENTYIDTLILPRSQHIPVACERAFGQTGRMKQLVGHSWGDGFSFRPFEVVSTDIEFRFSQKVMSQQAKRVKGSNISAVWTPHNDETLINGVLQGRRQSNPKGASILSRKRMLGLYHQIVHHIYSNDQLEHIGKSYVHTKRLTPANTRKAIKSDVRERALPGWSRNGEDDFMNELTDAA